MLKKITLIFFVFIQITAYSQYKEKIANQHFENKAYALCKPMFEELALDCLEGKNKCNIENIRKAAICNYKLFQYETALRYFKQLNEKEKYTEEEHEMIVQSLLFLGKYSLVDQFLIESNYLFPENELFNTLKSTSKQRNELLKDSLTKTIHFLNINSGKGDFGANYYEDGIIYISKSENVGFLNKKYNWDNSYFTNLVYSQQSGDTTFQEPELDKKFFNSRVHDGPISFAKNNTYCVVTRNRIDKEKEGQEIHLGLYFSEKIGEEWSVLKPFTYNSPKYNVGHGFLTQNADTLFFASDMEGSNGKSDLFVSYFRNNEWSEPENLGSNINTTQNEFFPFYKNGTLYFSSNGHFGLGGLDLFKTQLNKNNTPKNLGYPINSSADDFALVLDSTNNKGLFSSNRKETIDNLYAFNIKEAKIKVEGYLFAQYRNLEPIGNNPVWLINTTSGKQDTLKTESNGYFTFDLKPNQTYKIESEKREFELIRDAGFNTDNFTTDSTLYCEIVLRPTTVIVQIRVVEKGPAGEVIPLADVTVTDYATKTDTTLISNALGLVTVKVERNKTYWVHGSKKGYIDGDQAFNSANALNKVIDVDLGMKPISIGEKFKLENIFYDLNKSSLREESKIALDKLALFLLKNDLTIELSAHTDARGKSSYNQRLSFARAQSCVDYLISQGVKKSNIKARGYGETQLVNHCKDGVKCSEQEHQENRRTEVKIIGF